MAAKGRVKLSASGERMSAAQAAARLGVKRATLYAYVSRGLLTRMPDKAKASAFDPVEVERLATRGRRAAGPKPQSLLVETALTDVRDDAIAFRGRSAIALAVEGPFERVAEWLWSGSEQDAASAKPGAFVAQRAAVALARAVQAGLPEDSVPLERLRVIGVVLGSTDPLRYETSQRAVIATARTLLAGMIESLPRIGREVASQHGLAARLWPRLTALPANAARLHALDCAMSLCADHALSPSTLAVRIAAAQRADPYAVVQTGLGALSGALHGAASLLAEELIAEVEAGGEPGQVIGARLRRAERIPGFGHALHPAGDPRTPVLLARLAPAFAQRPALAASSALIAMMRERGLPPPNVDFALATLARAARMSRGASEAIMALARIAGWIAHALEEYAAPTRFPSRALYVGQVAKT
jgi:citrate synthase